MRSCFELDAQVLKLRCSQIKKQSDLVSKANFCPEPCFVFIFCPPCFASVFKPNTAKHEGQKWERGTGHYQSATSKRASEGRAFQRIATCFAIRIRATIVANGERRFPCPRPPLLALRAHGRAVRRAASEIKSNVTHDAGCVPKQTRRRTPKVGSRLVPASPPHPGPLPGVPRRGRRNWQPLLPG